MPLQRRRRRRRTVPVPRQLGELYGSTRAVSTLPCQDLLRRMPGTEPAGTRVHRRRRALLMPAGLRPAECGHESQRRPRLSAARWASSSAHHENARPRSRRCPRRHHHVLPLDVQAAEVWGAWPCARPSSARARTDFSESSTGITSGVPGLWQASARTS